MKVKDLIEILKTLDQEATVEIPVFEYGDIVWGDLDKDFIKTVSFDSKFSEGKPWHGKTFVHLGDL